MFNSKELLKNAVKISSKEVLSLQNKENCIRKLTSMKPIDIRSDKQIKARNAAVLVPLCIISNELSMLFTIRAPHLKANRGQVAFPGGMEDKSDLNLEETALRETREEIGYSGSVDVWCPGPRLGREDILITPFLGFLGEIEINQFNLNYDEVSNIFALSLEHLCDVDNFRNTQFRSGNKKGGGYKLPVYLGGPEKIWGVTALITHIFLTALVPNYYDRHKIKFQKMISRHLPSKNSSSS